jgi:putative DNA primase/helicase
MEAVGLTLPDVIKADGRLHRFSTNGKPDDDAGWYVLYKEGIPAGACGDWRSGVRHKWCADIGRPLTRREEEEHRAKLEAIKHLREVEQNRRREEARQQANLIWDEAVPCASHSYLAAKEVGANGVRLFRGELVIPLRERGKLHSLQFMSSNGDKRFLPGGRVSACYFSIGSPNGKDALCIAEGFATGASIHEATGLPVAVAFNAGNLKAVAIAIQGSFPGLPLILCADDDHATSGNPGLAKAREAAKAVNGQVAVPDFESNRPSWATDFNDMAKLRGKEAVSCAISTAVAKTRSNSQSAVKDPASEYKEAVELVCATEVNPEPISWLWEGYLAVGKLHILGGAPGTGKTTISMALAAVVSRAGCWPDGTKSPLGNIVIWSGEDNPADTLVPRLELAGVDRRRIYFVDAVRKYNSTRSFDPARDIEPLKRRIAEIGNVKLLIIDPVVSAIAGDSHKNAEVRRGLQPLADLAASTGCAVLGITHFSKGTAGRDPLERITGSVAFGAVARVVMVAARRQPVSEEGNDARLFLRAKSNIGPDDGGFEYELKQGDVSAVKRISASYVAWGAAVTGSARDLLEASDAAGEPRKETEIALAKEFLSGVLARGPVDQTEVQALAEKAKYSWATIRRAKKALKIESIKEGGHFGDKALQKWMWRLPAPEDAQDAQDDEGEQDRQWEDEIREDVQPKNVSTFSTFEHLQDDEDIVEVEI